MVFSEYFTLLDALKVLTPMEIVINYGIEVVVEQLNKYSADINIADFITEVIEESKEVNELVALFITTSSSLKH